MVSIMERLQDKKFQVVMFASTAVALYGYDQGMMSLINTNYDYLETMGIAEDDPMVGIIVSAYYLGCAVGAVGFSRFADWKGRKNGIFFCLATASVGSLIMFFVGIGGSKGGLAVNAYWTGGADAVVPVCSSETQEDDARGVALAQEFQANILGLNMAFILNVILTHNLGKRNEWAWRILIIAMQIYPIILFAVIAQLPETPRWYILHENNEKAKYSIATVFGEDEVANRFKELTEAHDKEMEDGGASWGDMLWLSGRQFHPTVVTIMGQVNQALTGYGAISVYGPQIFELLGFEVKTAEFITLGNYLFYLAMMTFAWMLIDRYGRRWLIVRCILALALAFSVFGGLASYKSHLHIPLLATGIPGIIVLYLATAVFGIGWLVPPWLIPTEIYPSTCRAQGAAVFVVIWGFANFAVTLLTPIMFNNLKYWLFLVFYATNAFAGWWSWMYCPESGGRTFEENQDFFKEAAERGRWGVRKVKKGEWLHMSDAEEKNQDGEGEPLLRRAADYVRNV